MHPPGTGIGVALASLQAVHISAVSPPSQVAQSVWHGIHSFGAGPARTRPSTQELQSLSVVPIHVRQYVAVSQVMLFD